MLTSVADVREQRRDVERYGRSSAILTSPLTIMPSTRHCSTILRTILGGHGGQQNDSSWSMYVFTVDNEDTVGRDHCEIGQ